MIPPIDRVLRARLAALLTRHGTSASAAGRAMGRSHMWLLRKLDPARPDCRPLTVDDLGEVLEHLGEPATALLEPVLLEGDDLILWRCRAGAPNTRAKLVDLFRAPEQAIERLVGQGLLELVDDSYNTTSEGIALLTSSGRGLDC